MYSKNSEFSQGVASPPGRLQKIQIIINIDVKIQCQLLDNKDFVGRILNAKLLTYLFPLSPFNVLHTHNVTSSLKMSIFERNFVHESQFEILFKKWRVTLELKWLYDVYLRCNEIIFSSYLWLFSCDRFGVVWSLDPPDPIQCWENDDFHSIKRQLGDAWNSCHQSQRMSAYLRFTDHKRCTTFSSLLSISDLM